MLPGYEDEDATRNPKIAMFKAEVRTWNEMVWGERDFMRTNLNNDTPVAYLTYPLNNVMPSYDLSPNFSSL